LGTARSGKLPALLIYGTRDYAGLKTFLPRREPDSVQEAPQSRIVVPGPARHLPVPKSGSTESIHLADQQ